MCGLPKRCIHPQLMARYDQVLIIAGDSNMRCNLAHSVHLTLKTATHRPGVR